MAAYAQTHLLPIRPLLLLLAYCANMAGAEDLLLLSCG